MSKQQKARAGPLANFLTDPSLFEEDEPTFIDTFAKRRVYVHLVPAPWSRVILLSFCYAIGINFVKLLWFEFVGRPSWHATDARTAAMSEGEAETFLGLLNFAPYREAPKSSATVNRGGEQGARAVNGIVEK